MQGFIDFIREQGVVGLAIGFILGGAVSKLVSAIVADLIQPALSYILGASSSISSLMVGRFAIGHLFIAFLDFVIIAAVVYFIFRGLGLQKLDKKKV